MLIKTKKPIIGIISENYYEKERPFNSYTKFVNNYSTRIIQSGGLPFGILSSKKDIMDLCDGFIITGGAHITTAMLQKIAYIVKNNKPCLAICLGMQALIGYDYLVQNNKKFKQILESEFLKEVNGHNQVDPFYLDKIDKVSHNVFLEKNCIINRIMQQEIINVPSLHNFQVKEEVLNNSKLFKIVGKSKDNVIEVIESVNNDFFIGVQFHPELNNDFLPLFKELVNNAKKLRFFNKIF